MSAAALENEAEAGGRAPASGASARLAMLLGLALVALLPFSPGTFTIIAVFMAPTWFIGCFRGLQTPGAVATVAGLNVAGILPALYHLWHKGGDFDTAFRMLFDSEFLTINFAAAGLGVAMLLIAPFIARTWVDIAGQRLLRRAQAEREKLLDEWGEALEREEQSADADEED